MDPNLIVSLSEKQVLLFWNLKKPKKPFFQHKIPIYANSISWSKDGKILFFNDWNKILFIKKEQPKKKVKKEEK
jgi:sugar lactone lactonase YvrE